MALTRTPKERFTDIPNFPYPPKYLKVSHRHSSLGDPRMAYVDTGRGSETFLCLHGMPTWSFLYRKMIPVLEEQGRVIAPDFVGFGRSDKYTDPDSYSFDMFLGHLVSFIETLDLEDITLVCQDWGAILGLCAVDEMPERFSRLVIMNLGAFSRVQALANDNVDDPEIHEPFEEWQEFAINTRDLPISRIVDTDLHMGDDAFDSDLDEAVIRAYDAPFPDEDYKAGAWKWPQLVPTSLDTDGADKMLKTIDTLASWEKPAFVLYSDSDPISGPGRDFFRDLIPSATEQPDIWINDAGHFLQEDKGEEVAEHIVEFVDRTPTE